MASHTSVGIAKQAFAVCKTDTSPALAYSA